jgi:D-arabinose 1-dehydrogenase-like Zn-dependent alcohol dehydrogenase
MGFKTIAIGRGKDKEQMARELGAIQYIDSTTQNVGKELFRYSGGGENSNGNRKGAKVILATVPSSKAMSTAIEGLAINGKLIVIGASEEPIEIHPLLLLSGRRSVVGWPSGSSADSDDTLSFAMHSNVRSVNEVFPLERAQEAYDLMISGKVRFRAVLQP